MRTRQVSLEWAGKAEALAALADESSELKLIEAPVAPPEGREPDRVLWADAAEAARLLLARGYGGTVDLVYLDPPFGSGVDYTHEERLDGTATGSVARVGAYRDKWDDGNASYLDMLYPRICAMKPLLKPTGSIWIHVDWRANYLVRSLCDEIFGPDLFLNEIVWRRAPNLGRQARSGQFGRTLDTIVVYGASEDARIVPPQRLSPVGNGVAKLDPETGRYFTTAPRGDYTDASIARLEREGRVHRTSSGKVYIKYWLERDEDGVLCKRQPVDALWTDVPPLRHVSPMERTGYPTQKPRALLERIVEAACPEGGLVVDFFAGSGTTGAAAAARGRRFVLADASPLAICVARSRLLREGVGTFTIESARGSLPDAAGVPTARAHRTLAGLASVELTVGTAQPVAWAIGEAGGEPFAPIWHAERGSGRRPAELPLRAVVAIQPDTTELAARVYFVDGAVADLRVGVALAGASAADALRTEQSA